MSKNLEQAETAALVLYTDQSTRSVFNTQYNWSNVQFRKILGDELYEKYDSFNLVLHTIASASTSVAFNTAALAAATIDDRNVLISITGPAWKNNSYVYKNQTNTSTSIIGNYLINVGVAGGIGPPMTTVYPQININTFGKSGSDSFDLGIALTRIVLNPATQSYACGGATNGIQTDFPNFCFIFDIVGAELSEKGRRLQADLIPVVPRGGGTR
jgi:hypothetical protein